MNRPSLRSRHRAGLIAAIALALIGLAGYVWPRLDSKTLDTVLGKLANNWQTWLV